MIVSFPFTKSKSVDRFQSPGFYPSYVVIKNCLRPNASIWSGVILLGAASHSFDDIFQPSFLDIAARNLITKSRPSNMQSEKETQNQKKRERKKRKLITFSSFYFCKHFCHFFTFFFVLFCLFVILLIGAPSPFVQFAFCDFCRRNRFVQT